MQNSYDYIQLSVVCTHFIPDKPDMSLLTFLESLHVVMFVSTHSLASYSEHKLSLLINYCTSKTFHYHLIVLC